MGRRSAARDLGHGSQMDQAHLHTSRYGQLSRFADRGRRFSVCATVRMNSASRFDGVRTWSLQADILDADQLRTKRDGTGKLVPTPSTIRPALRRHRRGRGDSTGKATRRRDSMGIAVRPRVGVGSIVSHPGR